MLLVRHRATARLRGAGPPDRHWRVSWSALMSARLSRTVWRFSCSASSSNMVFLQERHLLVGGCTPLQHLRVLCLRTV